MTATMGTALERLRAATVARKPKANDAPQVQLPEQNTRALADAIRARQDAEGRENIARGNVQAACEAARLELSTTLGKHVSTIGINGDVEYGVALRKKTLNLADALVAALVAAHEDCFTSVINAAVRKALVRLKDLYDHTDPQAQYSLHVNGDASVRDSLVWQAIGMIELGRALAVFRDKGEYAMMYNWVALGWRDVPPSEWLDAPACAVEAWLKGGA